MNKIQNFPDNPNIKVISAKETGLFTNYIFKAIPLAFDESMSYYETLCGLLSYLQNVIIPTVNNNAEAVAELQNLYIQLHDYVENYLNDLNLQDEVNNKLDQMVKDGTFERILSKYIDENIDRTFTTVDIMKNEDLQDKMKVKTLGYNEINDKGGCEYYITQNKPEKGYYETLNNGNYALLIIKEEMNIKSFNDNLINGIKYCNTLYLNENEYFITINDTIEKNNINLIGNNSIINTTSNVDFLFNFNNSVIKNIKFNETNINDKTKNIIFKGNNLLFENCEFISTTTYKNDNIENVTFKKCCFNSYYREITQGKGRLSNLNIINCNFKREQNYSTPYEGDTRILIYNFNGQNIPLNEELLKNYGNNINIKNCYFNNCNKRQIHIFNNYNVNIENNIINSSGIDSSLLGGSDDLVSIDFVKYFKINNNYFGSSGENELDILSSCYGEISNNYFEKPYDYFIIDINYSDYVRSFGNTLNDKTLLKSSDVTITNNKIKDSTTYTFNITPSDSIHIHDNDITNNTSNNIILFNDFGLNTPEHPSGLTISNLDIGKNNVKTSIGNFGKVFVRTNYNYIINNNSGHLSEDICHYEIQTVNSKSLIYCTTNFPCKNGIAMQKINLDDSYRSVTPALTRVIESNVIVKGIDFIGNRYNSPAWNTLFYSGDYLDKYPLNQKEEGNGNYDGTRTTGEILFKSW